MLQLFRVNGGVGAALIGDLSVTAGRVILAGQLGQRHFGEVGVGHVLGTVGESDLEGLGEAMDVVGRVDLGVGHIEVLQDVQDLNQMGAAGGCRGQRIDGVVTVGGADRLTNLDLVVGQVFHGQHAALGLHRVHHGLGHVAGVERVTAAVRDGLQSSGQIGVGQGVAHFVGHTIVQVQVANFAHGSQTGVLAFQLLLEGSGHEIAVVGQVNGGLEDLLTGHGVGAVVLQQVLHAGNLAGGRNGQAADAAHGAQLLAVLLELLHLAGLVQPNLGVGRSGSDLAEVDDLHLFGLGVVDGHEAAAAQAGEVGLNHTQGVGHSRRCIEGVAALLQDLQASLAGVPAAGCHSTGLTGGVTVVLLLLKVLVVGEPDFLFVRVSGRRGRLTAGRGRGALAAAGHRQPHYQCHKQGNVLFHLVSSFVDEVPSA